jgi:hypothetical protein
MGFLSYESFIEERKNYDNDDEFDEILLLSKWKFKCDIK